MTFGQLCQQGPEERLSETERTQPAMLAAGIAVWRAWQRHGGARRRCSPATASASTAPSSPPDRSTSRPRSRSCASAARRCSGPCPAGRARWRRSSASTTRPSRLPARRPPRARSCSRSITTRRASSSSPARRSAVARAIEACKARGAKRAVLLPVSVPSHSALMKPAAEALRERLRGLDDSSPAVRGAFLRRRRL